MAAWSVREAALENWKSFWKERTAGGKIDQEGRLEEGRAMCLELDWIVVRQRGELSYA